VISRLKQAFGKSPVTTTIGVFTILTTLLHAVLCYQQGQAVDLNAVLHTIELTAAGCGLIAAPDLKLQ
jgi:hypothetical protein